MRIEQLEAKAAEDFSLDVETLVAEYGPDAAGAADPGRGGRGRGGGRAGAGAGALRPADPGEAGRQGRARPGPARQGQPAGAGGVRRAGGALQVPLRPARGPQGHPPGPAHRGQGRGRPDPRGLRRRRSRTPRASSSRSSTVLFPGGEGRLVLTDPEDMLTTGVEVEARPPGKKIKRLSLLSGGERSLTAVAMLVRDLPGPAQPVLHHGRGRGGPRRRQPRPADHADSGSCGRRAS